VKVAVLSANLGHYEAHAVPFMPQVVPDGTVDLHWFTDANFPTRHKALMPALQCAIPKMFGWELKPGYDVYIWIDASRGLLRPDTAAWFLEKLGHAEMAVFLHPERSTIQAEYEFIKARMARPGETYLTSRYAGEWIDEQYKAVHQPWHFDNKLYASTAFAYRPTVRVRAMMREWWFHKSRYLIHDQLAFPYVLREHRVSVVEMTESVYACAHLPYTRKK
jgi:hypothetical protein